MSDIENNENIENNEYNSDDLDSNSTYTDDEISEEQPKIEKKVKIPVQEPEKVIEKVVEKMKIEKFDNRTKPRSEKQIAAFEKARITRAENLKKKKEALQEQQTEITNNRKIIKDKKVKATPKATPEPKIKVVKKPRKKQVVVYETESESEEEESESEEEEIVVVKKKKQQQKLTRQPSIQQRQPQPHQQMTDYDLWKQRFGSML
jgi:hypothetical protein